MPFAFKNSQIKYQPTQIDVQYIRDCGYIELYAQITI